MPDDESEIPPTPPGSIFQSNLSLEAKLNAARTELLDLSVMNGLLHSPRSAKNSKILDVRGERSAEVYRLLVREGKALTFLPGKGTTAEDEAGDASIAELALPDKDSEDLNGLTE
jgi:hypothetical protein